MKAAKMVGSNARSRTSRLAIYDPDTELEQTYNRWLSKTSDATVAAILTLASVWQFAPVADNEADPLPRSDYLSVKQAAAKYNLGQRTVYRMVEQGLPVSRVGKAIRIQPKDLQRWLADSETILH